MRVILFSAIVFSAILAACARSASAAGDVAATEAYLRDALRMERVPGASWAILRKREIVAVGAYGDTGSGAPVTADTPFMIGSLTKSFTGMATMQLVEDGKIDLDAPVIRYLPWFKIADAESTARMTVRHALNQTTGLAWIDGLGWLASPDVTPGAVRARVEALATVRPVAPPGTRMIYCNANYAIAGAIVETVSGQSYESFVRVRIIEPLGLTHTSADVTTFAMPGFALPHRYWFWRPFLLHNRVIGRSDLGSYLISSSARDMARWLDVHLRGANPYGPPVLSAQGFETLHAGALPFPFDPNDRYAMGWSDDRWHGVRVLSHYGSWIGYHANMLIAPETGDGLVLLTNAESYNGSRPRWEIAKNAFRRMLGQVEVKRSWFDASVAGTFVLAGLCLWLAVWAGRGMWRLFRPGAQPQTLLVSLMPVIIGAGGAIAIYLGVPAAFDADLVSIWWTTPDAGVLIAGAITLSAIAGVVNSLARFTSQR